VKIEKTGNLRIFGGTIVLVLGPVPRRRIVGAKTTRKVIQNWRRSGIDSGARELL
jgi:hypothetical protein